MSLFKKITENLYTELTDYACRSDIYIEELDSFERNKPYNSFKTCLYCTAENVGPLSEHNDP